MAAVESQTECSLSRFLVLVHMGCLLTTIRVKRSVDRFLRFLAGYWSSSLCTDRLLFACYTGTARSPQEFRLS